MLYFPLLIDLLNSGNGHKTVAKLDRAIVEHVKSDVLVNVGAMVGKA